MRGNNLLAVGVLLNLGGCASVPDSQDPFDMSDLEQLPTINLPARPLITACQDKLAGDSQATLDGNLEVSNRILTAADRNGFRDETKLHYEREDGSNTAIRFNILADDSCEVIRTFSAAELVADAATWDGRYTNGDLVPAGTYLVQLVSADNGRHGISRQLLVLDADDACDVPGAPVEWIIDREVAWQDAGKQIEIDRPGPLHLCIEARTVGGQRMLPNIDVNRFRSVDQSVSMGHSAVAFGIPSYGSSHLVQLSNLSGSVHLRIGVLPGTAPSTLVSFGDDTGLAFTREPDCHGQMFGFRHPYRAGLAPRIRREGIVINCVYGFLKEHTYYTQNPETGDLIEHQTNFAVTVEASGYTDENGAFSIELPWDRFVTLGIDRDAVPDQISVHCADREECGMEVQALGGVPGFPDGNIGLFGIPDIAANGLVARLITNHRQSIGPLDVPDFMFATDIASANSSPPNDLPVVIHEAFDPLLEDGTKQLAWFLGGQVVDHKRLDGKGLSESPCENPMNGPCFWCRWNIGCDQRREAAQSNPSIQQNERFRCHAPNQLLQLVGNGYDVWLVDSVRRNSSIYEIAASSITMYQEILDYDGPDPDRRMALVGLSLGGVSSRIALRAWEVLQEQKNAGGQSFQEIGDGVQLPDAQSLVYGPDRVALFLSFDAPHLGARMPQAFQAYVKDRDFAGGPRFPNLLNSKPAEELLKEYVLPMTNTPCWGGETGIGDCAITTPVVSSPGTLANVVSSADVLVQESIDTFASMPPGDPEPVGFSAGLPRTIPSVALANGSLARNPDPNSDKVLDVQFDLLTSKYHHQIKDTLNQPLGSGLDTFCSAKELESEEELVAVWEYLYADCRENTRKFFPGPLGWIGKGFCFIGGIALGGQSDLEGHPGVGVSADIDIPMRPLADGTGQYPTFVETSSALIIRPRLRLQDVPWLDYSTRPVSVSHFSVDDEQCRFVMYHLDGQMKGDLDGYPACSSAVNQSCLAGGRQPGARIDPSHTWEDSAAWFCDPNDANPAIIPLGPRLNEIKLKNTLINTK